MHKKKVWRKNSVGLLIFWLNWQNGMATHHKEEVLEFLKHTCQETLTKGSLPNLVMFFIMLNSSFEYAYVASMSTNNRME